MLLLLAIPFAVAVWLLFTESAEVVRLRRENDVLHRRLDEADAAVELMRDWQSAPGRRAAVVDELNGVWN